MSQLLSLLGGGGGAGYNKQMATANAHNAAADALSAQVAQLQQSGNPADAAKAQQLAGTQQPYVAAPAMSLSPGGFRALPG